MSKALGEPTLELLRQVTDRDWTIGVEVALLQDRFYSGQQLSVPVRRSELAAHRNALRHFVACRDLSKDGLTILTAVQLKLERAFDDVDADAPRQSVELDVTEVLVLAIAQFGAAQHYRERRNHREATVHRLLGETLLAQVEDSSAVPNVLGEWKRVGLLPGGGVSAG